MSMAFKTHITLTHDIKVKTVCWLVLNMRIGAAMGRVCLKGSEIIMEKTFVANVTTSVVSRKI